jgi:hypothetical protein
MYTFLYISLYRDIHKFTYMCIYISLLLSLPSPSFELSSNDKAKAPANSDGGQAAAIPPNPSRHTTKSTWGNTNAT